MMSAALVALGIVIGICATVAVAAVMAGADDPKDTNVFQGGPMTPPAEPKDPNTVDEWHAI